VLGRDLPIESPAQLSGTIERILVQRKRHALERMKLDHLPPLSNRIFGASINRQMRFGRRKNTRTCLFRIADLRQLLQTNFGQKPQKGRWRRGAGEHHQLVQSQNVDHARPSGAVRIMSGDRKAGSPKKVFPPLAASQNQQPGRLNGHQTDAFLLTCILAEISFARSADWTAASAGLSMSQQPAKPFFIGNLEGNVEDALLVCVSLHHRDSSSGPMSEMVVRIEMFRLPRRTDPRNNGWEKPQ